MRLDAQLEELHRWLGVARADLSSEPVHELRVTVRRVRAFLALGGQHVLVDDLRWLVGSLGRLRDLDVALETPVGAAGPFHAWLAGARAAEAREATRVLEHPRLEALVVALAQVRPVSKRHAQRALERLEVRLLETLKAARREATIEALHEVRKAVRRKRYALEWLGRDAAALQATQSLVGEACDLNLLHRLLAECGELAGASRVERALKIIVPALAATRWPRHVSG